MVADWPLDPVTARKVRSIIFSLPYVPRELEDDVISAVQIKLWEKRKALLANPGVLSVFVRRRALDFLKRQHGRKTMSDSTLAIKRMPTVSLWQQEQIVASDCPVSTAQVTQALSRLLENEQAAADLSLVLGFTESTIGTAQARKRLAAMLNSYVDAPQYGNAAIQDS